MVCDEPLPSFGKPSYDMAQLWATSIMVHGVRLKLC